MFYLSPTEIIEENNKIKELTLEKNKLRKCWRTKVINW